MDLVCIHKNCLLSLNRFKQWFTWCFNTQRQRRTFHLILICDLPYVSIWKIRDGYCICFEYTKRFAYIVQYITYSMYSDLHVVQYIKCIWSEYIQWSLLIRAMFFFEVFPFTDINDATELITVLNQWKPIIKMKAFDWFIS